MFACSLQCRWDLDKIDPRTLSICLSLLDALDRKIGEGGRSPKPKAQSPGSLRSSLGSLWAAAPATLAIFNGTGIFNGLSSRKSDDLVELLQSWTNIFNRISRDIYIIKNSQGNWYIANNSQVSSSA